MAQNLELKTQNLKLTTQNSHYPFINFFITT